MEEEEQKKGWAVWAILAVCILATVMVTKWMIKANSSAPAALTEEYTAAEPKAVEDADGPPEDDLPARETEKGRTGSAGAEAGGASAGQARTQAQPAEMSDEARREAAFLRKHDKEIKRYQDYLASLGRKYRAQYPALKRLDSDFAKMDRYMALKKQYDSDRDAYKWARGTIALPEVRKRLLSASTDPEVMKGLIGLALEALKHPPSNAIHDEMLRFLCSDKQAAPYVDSMSMDVVQNLTMTLPSAVTPGMDLTPLKKIGDEISSGGSSRGANP